MFKPIAILSALVLGVYLASRAQLAKNLDVKIIGVDFTGGIVKPELTIIFNLYNPTSNSSTLQKIAGNIYADGSIIGIIEQDFNTEIKSQAETNIRVKINLLPFNVFSSIFTMIKNKTANISFDGSIKADGITIPLKLSND